MLSLPIQALALVAQTGSITQAAQRLGLSQPSVTNYIRQMEDKYGVELFYRQGKALVPSEEARQLLPKIHDLQRQASHIEFMLRDFRSLQRGTLRISATGPYYLLPSLRAFNQHHPHISLAFSQQNSEKVLEAVLNYEVEIGSSSLLIENKRLYRRLLAVDTLQLVAHRSHPLASQPHIRLSDLKRHTLLLREPGSMTRKAILDTCKALGVELRHSIEFGSREAIHWGLLKNIGCSLLPSKETPDHPSLVIIPISDLSLHLNEYVYILQERRNAPLIQAFLQHLPAA